jgi:hypothetical protein
MQRAAMGGIDADGAFRTASQANESTGFGTVPMQDVRSQPPDQIFEMRPYQNICRVWLAVNGKTPNAELEAGRDLRQRRLGAFTAGQAIGDNADMVAAIGLTIGNVQDVTEDSADRRAHCVQDTKRLIWFVGHD